MRILISVLLITIMVVDALVVTLSPRAFRIALFRPASVCGRLVVGFVAVSGVVFVIWQIAVWYNHSNGIYGVPPVMVHAVLTSFLVFARAGYLWRREKAAGRCPGAGH